MSTRLQPGKGAARVRRAAWPALHLYARLDAHVNGNGGGGTTERRRQHRRGRPAYGRARSSSAPTPPRNAANRDYAVPTYMALASHVRRATASVGYAGTASDGLTQLDAARTR